MSQGGRKFGKTAKQAEVERLVQEAADKHEQEKLIAEQQAIFEKQQRENNLLAACRSHTINEPALWFRAPDHEGAMLAMLYMMDMQRQAEAMVRAQMAERGVIVPEGTIKI